MMQTEKLNAIKGAITDGKLVRAAGGITQRTEQSDKLGFDWRIFTVNDVDVRKDYVEQANPVGTRRRQSHRIHGGHAAHQQRLLPRGQCDQGLHGRLGRLGGLT